MNIEMIDLSTGWQQWCSSLTGQIRECIPYFVTMHENVGDYLVMLVVANEKLGFHNKQVIMLERCNQIRSISW